MPIIVKKNETISLLRLIKQKLNSEDLIVLPTETVYGLAGLGTSLKAAKKIYELKKRPLSKKLIFHCSDLSMVKKYFYVNDEIKILSKRFWPGPLTFILKVKSKKIPKILTIKGSCAVRVPNNKFTQKVIKYLNKPLVMPSANRYKQISPVTPKMVFDQFIGSQLMIIDDGHCKIGIESTILKMDNSNVSILRNGHITKKHILKLMPYLNFNHNSTDLSFPGSDKKHYSPNKKLYLNIKNKRKLSAFINFGKNKIGQFKNLSEKNSLKEAARNLYHYIYLADINKKFKTISIAPIPNEGVGIAINDRLKRASSRT